MALTYNPNQQPPNAKFMINVKDGKHKAKGYIARIDLDPGITEEAIEAHTRNRNCLGIVLTTLGAGNIPEQIIPCLKEAGVKHHLPIFAVSPFTGGTAGVVYEAAENASKAGVSFLGDQSGAVAWVKAHWILANGLGMDSKDFIRNMQRIVRGEGTVSGDAEKIPAIHEQKAEDGRDNFRTRVQRNRRAIEGYRKEKGPDCRYIKPDVDQQPVLPKAEVFHHRAVKKEKLAP
ncbi:MAG: hypothetical protein V1721_02910 [Pseudomonadota bacterium]